MTINYEFLKALAAKAGTSVKNVLALSPKNDPFYAGTPGDRERGEWFARQYKRAGYGPFNTPHLRRIHYWIVSQSPAVIMPNGKPYENTERCWDFLMEASKSARYLGLVAINGIQDNKNPQPHVYALYSENRPEFQIQIPDLSAPQIDIYGLWDANVQPYHIELWCEKSTMNDVLLPVCSHYNANLVTFEGEVSITSVMVNLIRRIQSSNGKPTRIFYISDFDPAGNSMPVAMSRKLEYALVNSSDDLDVKVRPLALTGELVQQYNLPRIPIKETEKRAGKFEQAFGSGAVELDALEAIYPGVLANLVDEALSEYYSDDARREVDEQAEALRQEVEAATAAITAKYQAEIAALHQMQEELRAIRIDTAKYTVERYEPHADEDPDAWLYDSQRDYLDQIAYYKAHKGIELDIA